MGFDKQCDAILPLLHDQLDRHKFDVKRLSGAVQWFYSPVAAPKMLGNFGEAVTVVYDCMATRWRCSTRTAKAKPKPRSAFLIVVPRRW
jgi:hypothetical protein